MRKKTDKPMGPHLDLPWWRVAASARCASLPRAPFNYTRVRLQCDFCILGRQVYSTPPPATYRGWWRWNAQIAPVGLDLYTHWCIMILHKKKTHLYIDLFPFSTVHTFTRDPSHPTKRAFIAHIQYYIYTYICFLFMQYTFIRDP